MAAKKTGELVPLCHPISLDGVELEFDVLSGPPRVLCRARVGTHDRTGVEMEALTAVQVALLTIYDMCKSVDRAMTMEGIRLMSKTGGKSGDYRRTD
jgi:cyclic pyranopterin phosphate synthase